jgi:hypothetical protein
MRLSIVIILAAAGAAFVFARPPEDRPEEYLACVQLHPERFCRLKHLQATVAEEQAHARR